MKNKTYNVAKFRALCKNRLRQMNAQTLGSGLDRPSNASSVLTPQSRRQRSQLRPLPRYAVPPGDRFRASSSGLKFHVFEDNVANRCFKIVNIEWCCDGFAERRWRASCLLSHSSL